MGYFLLLLVLLLPTLADANTIYVGTGGSNSNSCGTATNPGTPIRDIGFAISNCMDTGSGHVIRVQDGTYNECLDNIMPSGTPGAVNRLEAVNARQAILRPTFPCGGGGSVIFWASRSYITVSGMKIDMSVRTNWENVGGYWRNGNTHHTTIDNNEICCMVVPTDLGNGGAGISSGVDEHDNLTRGTYVHDLSYANSDANVHGFYLSGDNNRYEHNLVERIAQHGIQFYISGRGETEGHTAVGNVVISNTFRNTGAAGILMGSGNNNYAINNVLTQTCQSGVGGPGAINLNGRGVAADHNYAYNNTVYSNPCEAIYFEGGFGSEAKNNILWQNNSDSVGGSTGSNTQDRNLATNPQFQGEGSGNFHLAPGSPAIGNGLDLSGVFCCDAEDTTRTVPWDQGAFESDGGGGPGPTPTKGTFYMAPPPLGNDSTHDCDAAKLPGTPKATFSGTFPCALGGSTLILLAGTYAQTLDSRDVTIPSGTAGDPTIIRAETGQTVTLAPSVSGATPVVYLGTGKQDITLERLIIQGGGTAANGIVLDGTTRVKVLGGEVVNTAYATILMRGGTANEVVGTSVHDNDNEHGIYLNNANSNTLIDGVTVFDYTGAGIYASADDYPTSSTTNATISRSTCRTMKAGGTEACVVVGHGSGHTVVNTLIYGAAKGVRVDDNVTGVKLYHNTITGNTGLGIQIDATGTVADMVNNIVFNNNAGGTQILNNGTITAQAANLTIDPGFRGAPGNDYHLVSPPAASAARNAGATGTGVALDNESVFRPQGTGPDIGAFEVVEGSASVPIDCNAVPVRYLTGFMSQR